MTNLGLFVASVAAQASATLVYTLTQSLWLFSQDAGNESNNPTQKFIDNIERVAMIDVSFLAPAYAVFWMLKKDIRDIYVRAQSIRRILAAD